LYTLSPEFDIIVLQQYTVASFPGLGFEEGSSSTLL